MEDLVRAVARLKKQAERDRAPTRLATVGAVYADGITLIFDGETAPSTKKYRYNKNGAFAAGDRVVLDAVGGTYVVAYAIGGST